MATQTLKNQNDAKASRLKEAKRITQLLLRKNRNIKGGIHKIEHDSGANKEVRSFGLKTSV